MFTVVAPAPIATSSTCARNSSSVREASSAENSTSSHSARARATPLAVSRRISSCAMLSLYWRWIALVARNTWMRWRGASDSARAGVDVFGGAARQSADDRAVHFTRHGRHAVEVPARGGGKSRLDDIHTEFGERARDPQFLRRRHAASRGLLPV